MEFGSRQWGGSRWELDWQLATAEQVENGDEGQVTASWEIRRGEGNTGDTKRGRGRSSSEKRTELLELIRAKPFQFTKNQLIEKVGGNKAAVTAELDGLIATRQVEIQKAPAQDVDGRIVARPRYGPGPGFSFKMSAADGGASDDEA